MYTKHHLVHRKREKAKAKQNKTKQTEKANVATWSLNFAIETKIIINHICYSIGVRCIEFVQDFQLSATIFLICLLCHLTSLQIGQAQFVQQQQKNDICTYIKYM